MKDKLAKLREAQLLRWVKGCDEMLTKANVPEWVENEGSSVPSNCILERLKWFLARRKDVKKWEIDQNLQRSIAIATRHAELSDECHDSHATPGRASHDALPGDVFLRSGKSGTGAIFVCSKWPRGAGRSERPTMRHPASRTGGPTTPIRRLPRDPTTGRRP
jgi:hypothetical protein